MRSGAGAMRFGLWCRRNLRGSAVSGRKNIRFIEDPRTGVEVALQDTAPRLSATPGSIDALGPALGADNRKIYQEILGMSASENSALEEVGIVCSSLLKCVQDARNLGTRRVARARKSERYDTFVVDCGNDRMRQSTI